MRTAVTARAGHDDEPRRRVERAAVEVAVAADVAEAGALSMATSSVAV
jgi:hypothetical protein